MRYFFFLEVLKTGLITWGARGQVRLLIWSSVMFTKVINKKRFNSKQLIFDKIVTHGEYLPRGKT